MAGFDKGFLPSTLKRTGLGGKRSVWLLGAVCAVLAVVGFFGCRVAGQTRGDGNDVERFWKTRGITSFKITSPVQAQGKVTGELEITVVVPAGTSRKFMTAQIDTIEGSTISPDPAIPADYTQVREFNILSPDGVGTITWSVMVIAEISDTREISSFALAGIDADSVIITDEDANTGRIDIVVPYGTDVSNRTAEIVHNGEFVSPLEGFPRNFNKPLPYEVVSARGNKRVYTVTVTIASNTANDLINFVLDGAQGVITGNTITVTLPYGSSLTDREPVIDVSTDATVNPASGQKVTFTDGVAKNYTVTAASGSEKIYSVTVKVALNTAKKINSFMIESYQGTINETAGTISVTVPANMPITALKPVISFDGDRVSPASDAQQNFTNPVDYTVTAADGSIKTYRVTVTSAPPVSVTFVSIMADGASWKAQTTTLTLKFSTDMGTALEAKHITLTPASGTITKAASVTNKGNGTYTLAVDNIPGNEVMVTVKVADTEKIYGYNITGNPKATEVYKAPEQVNVTLKQLDGQDGIKTSRAIEFSFDKDINGLIASDITLDGGAGLPGLTKGTLTGSLRKYELGISGISRNNVAVTATPVKTGVAFTPPSPMVTVYKEQSTDAYLLKLEVEGSSLASIFDKDVLSYAMTVNAGTTNGKTINVTATKNNANAELKYVEADQVVTSGTPFASKTLPLGVNTVTVRVTAESGATKDYVLKITIVVDAEFPDGAIFDEFTVYDTATWNKAVNNVKVSGKNRNYFINISGNFNAPGNGSATFGSPTGITVIMRPVNANSWQASLSSTGNLLSIGPSQRIVLRDITLKGLTTGVNGAAQNNTVPLVFVGGSGAKFEMKGIATVSGNTGNANGGGVFVENAGVFIMQDNAKVSGNTVTNFGGGIYTDGNATVFTMQNNAEVSGNIAGSSGGGMWVNSGTFTMRDNAKVSGNTALYNGGGLFINSATATMEGDAKVSGNTATVDAGGLYLGDGTTLTMRGNTEVSGNIASTGGGGGFRINPQATLNMQDNVEVFGNTAKTSGGGVWINAGAVNIENGIVYGSGSSAGSKKNTAAGTASASISGTVKYGKFNSGVFQQTGSQTTTNQTIKVVNGNLTLLN